MDNIRTDWRHEFAFYLLLAFVVFVTIHVDGLNKRIDALQAEVASKDSLIAEIDHRIFPSQPGER
jgi:hypothetical protein